MPVSRGRVGDELASLHRGVLARDASMVDLPWPICVRSSVRPQMFALSKLMFAAMRPAREGRVRHEVLRAEQPLLLGGDEEKEDRALRRSGSATKARAIVSACATPEALSRAPL